jgi:mannosyltransferase
VLLPATRRGDQGRPALRSANPQPPPVGSRRFAVALGAIVALGVAVRFAGVGVQSYHHDEVITVIRVIPGSFGEMLHKVRVSESNPPLYYILAWGWSKVFGLEEAQLRSLSALFGAATVPVGYLIGRQLDGRRCGLILAALVALNPMLIWYSQEARSYALVIFFGALSLYFFLRARESGSGRDLALWALFSGLAFFSHYFAAFPIAIESAWLLLSQRRNWRRVVPAVAAIALAATALLPLLLDQINPQHINWIEGGSVGWRLWGSANSFLAGETGPVIGEPLRPRFALVPAVAVAVSLALLLWRGAPRLRRSAGVALAIGAGVVVLVLLAAAVGKDYLIARNLLPALVPLVAVVALGFTAARPRLSLVLVGALCAYWLAFAIYVTQTPNLQRPDFRAVGQALGAPVAARAIVSWRLASDPIRWYLPGKAVQTYGGTLEVREVDVVSKAGSRSAYRHTTRSLLASFSTVETVHAGRLTVDRYRARRPQTLTVPELKGLPTGFRANGVVVDRPPPAFRIGISAAKVAA